MESLHGIEKIHYLLFIVAHGLEKDGDMEFFLSVYAHMEHVLKIVFKIKPTTVLGNDSRYESPFLSRQLALAFVSIKEDPGRSVELVHYDSFGPVHYERTAGGHKLYFSEIYLLLFYVAELSFGVFIPLLTLGYVPYYKTEGYVKGSSVGIAFKSAFSKIILGFIKPVVEILQGGLAIIVLKGENGLEGSVKTGVRTFIRRNISLQKILVRFYLYIKQVGDIQNLGDL